MNRSVAAAGSWVISALLLCASSVFAQVAEPGSTPPGVGVEPFVPPPPRIITATAVLRGRVTENGGRPIRSAEVRLTSNDGRDSRIATTDASGQYEIRDLTPGAWNLRASKPGFVSHTPNTSETNRPITIANGQRLSMDIVLTKAGAIAGRVVDDAGEPLADVQVQAFKRRTPSDDSFTPVGVADKTDDTGAFRLYAIPPGTYYVRAIPDAGDRAPGFANDGHNIYYPGTPDVQNAETVTVAAGQEQVGLTVSIPPVVIGVAVAGTIVTAAGDPAGDDTSIHILRATTSGSGPQREMGLIGQVRNGAFRITNVPPGDYVIDVLSSLSRPESWERASLPIAVGTSSLNGVVVSLTPTRTLKGTLAADAGTTPPRTFPTLGIVVETPTAALGSDTTAVHTLGDFSLRGIWGMQSIAVTGLPRGWMIKSIDIAGHELGAGLVDFNTVPASATLRVLITDRVGELTGTVTAAREGRRAAVVVFPDDETKWQIPTRYIVTAPVGDDGTFRVSGLSEMSYRAVAVSWLDSNEIFDSALLAQMKRVGTPFTLREGEKKKLDLPLVER
jgi:hypothetical protein